MKFFQSAILSSLLLAAISTNAMAMGEQAQVFETAKAASIWDHSTDFYLRLDLEEIAGLRDQKFIWAGFQQETPGKYKGELVINQFAKDERRFNARAKLLEVTSTSKYFIIEVLDESGAVIKEVVLKSANHELLQ
ncbi:MAG: hypothetical protein EOP07_10540 [Proteobacteria bacterium]|nr:MAG: hypothetical protein EOP07_10540 [Pseudomonadota bacterium]